MKAALLVGVGLVSIAGVACSASSGDDPSSAEQDATADIRSLQAIDGTDKFVVVCKYHTAADPPEIVTVADILANRVCTRGGAPAPAGICSYEAGKLRVVVGSTVYERSIGVIPDAKVVCTEKGAGVFNGDVLHVFSKTSHSFNQYTTAYGASDPQLFATDDDLILVAGASLAVYKFDAMAVLPAPTSLTTVASFAPVVDTVGDAFLFYDGAVVHGFCGTSWVAASRVAPRAEAPGQISSHGNVRVMEFADFAFGLDAAACTLSRDVKTPRTASGGAPQPCAHDSSYGAYGEGGGCSSYGCWAQGGGCSSYGCWRTNGGCSSYGCWAAGGGCSSYGCWQAGGGCNSYGCWMEGGYCASNGCMKPSPSFPSPGAAFVCQR
jgi:hypothetical protein